MDMEKHTCTQTWIKITFQLSHKCKGTMCGRLTPYTFIDSWSDAKHHLNHFANILLVSSLLHPVSNQTSLWFVSGCYHSFKNIQKKIIHLNAHVSGDKDM